MPDPITPPTPPTPPAPAPTPPAPAPTPPAPAPDLMAEFAKLNATIAAQGATIQQLSDENARRRTETKAEREAREAADIASGNYKTKAERLEAEFAEAQKKIAALEPEAREWATHKQTTLAQIEAEGAALPAVFAPAFSLAQTVEQKRAIIAAAKAATPTTPTAPAPAPAPAPPAAPGGAPAPTPAPTASIDPRNMSPEEIETLERTNPAAFKALFDRSATAKPKGILSIIGLGR